MNVHSPAHAGHTAQGAPCPAPEDEAICFRDYFLTKIVFILRYRVAYEEIRREERPGRARAGGSFGAGAQAGRDPRPRAPLSHQIENDRWDPRPGHPANVRKALQVIGLPPDQAFSKERVSKAWRKMALKLHPDLKGGSEEAFKRLGKVKDFLMAGIAAGRTREAEN